jgi:16S rRNA G527 N7-methylase RsmG
MLDIDEIRKLTFIDPNQKKKQFGRSLRKKLNAEQLIISCTT